MLFGNQEPAANAFAHTPSIFKLFARTFLFTSLFTLSFTISGHAPAAGVTTQLLFNEGTGTTTADGSGNSHNGTLTNGPVWTTGKYGQGLSFDGSNDYVNIADHNNFTLDPVVSYTWSAWVRNTSFKEWSTVWSQTLNTSNFFYFYTHTTTDPDGGPVTNGVSVYWWVNNGASKLGAHSSNNVLTAGVWSYVTVTYDAAKAQNNRFSIYVNGTDVTARNDVSSAGTITSINPTNTRIGSNQPYGEYLNGAIDEVRYYRRLLSVAEIISDMNTGATGDTQAPTVSITAPAAAATVSGTGVSVTATAADNIGVAGVQFLLDGVNLGAEDISSPYSVTWNTTTATNGTHTLTARARDAAGNSTVSATRSVTVNNSDTQVPTVSITAPAAAATVSGTGVSVTATATDNIGVAGVQFLLDGVNLGAEDISAPFSVTWNTTTATNGAHTLTARARDAAGNTTLSATRSVTVNNADTQAPTVSITAPVAAATVSGTGVSVTATAADNIGVAGVQFLLDGVNFSVEDISSPYSVTWNTTAATNGTHTLTARARDAAGNTTVSGGIVVTVNNDTESPAVSIVAPADGATIAGIASINATATDNIGVVGVQFTVDGINFGAEDLTVPYTVSWNTATMADGNHTVAARARDAAGNISTSTLITVVLLNTIPDTESPTTSITSPADLDIVSGTVSVTANATDNTGVVAVQFLLDGNNIGTEDLAAPYNISWSTLIVANGVHTLSSRARDAAGNSTVSASITVTVDNDGEAPLINITSPAAGTISGTIAIAADATDNKSVAGVQFLLDNSNLGAEDVSAPYSVSWNTTTVSNGTHTITARARDAAGNNTTAGIITVTVNNLDAEAPAITLTAPAVGNVAGTITVAANASDNTGVTGVQFLLDGNNISPEDLTAPYSVQWNTINVANGSHTITAMARDAAGNSTISSPVIVTVNNDVQAPFASITAPAANATVNGTVSITANATDNTGVVGVQFLLDAVALGAEDLTAPYSVSWLTTGASNGTHSLTARVRDAAGNTATSGAVSVIVSNVTNLISAHHFNEGTGTAAADISGNSHNGTLTNGPLWVAGKYGQAISFDGTNDYLNIADHNNFTLDPAQSYTWSGWIKNNSFKEWSTVWSQTVSTSSFFYFYAHSSTDPDGGPVTNGISVYWWASNNNRLGVHSTNNVLTAGQWAHVAVTYNATQPQNNRFSIYVNGIDVTVRNDVSSVGTITSINPTNIRMASNQPFGEYLNGVVDEVRYYRRLLTAAEIITDMNTPLGTDNTAPVVTVTAPVNSAVLSGTVNVTANASDNFGVAGVQFLLDNVNLGTEDVTAPYTISWNTTTVGNGVHGLTARARDAAGNITVSTVTSVSVNNIIDTEAPAVNISSPANNETVSGIININAGATDNIGVSGVQFFLDDISLGAEDLAAPYSISWNTGNTINGSHILTAKARDASGNLASSQGIIVVVNNVPDTEPPTISLTSPAAGNLTGAVTINATANDNVGVAGVQFLLDGAVLGAEDVSAPFSYSWNTGLTTNGPHILSASARDASGNTTVSAGVSITVINSNLVISGISVTAVTSNTVTINWTTNIPANSQVKYGTTVAYGLSTLTDAGLVTSHSQIIYGLPPATLQHYQVLSADVSGAIVTSPDNTFTSATVSIASGDLAGRRVTVESGNKILPWTPKAVDGYPTVMSLAWNHFLNTMPNDPSTGMPAYYSRSYIDPPGSQNMANWPHNPAGLYAMLIESSLKYYNYSANTSVVQMAEAIGLWHLDHGMTLATDSWAAVPYASGNAGSLNYSGSIDGNNNGIGDGVGYLQPDKIGELGNAWLQLYKYNGNTRFRDAAIQAANVLSSKVRAGTVNQSPWPYRVNARTGAVREEYCSNTIAPIALLDNLIFSGLGDTSAYRAARNTAWTWLMNFPIQNNAWSQYFEDVPVQTTYNANLNQYNAMMTARYLLEHPEFDPNWETHVRSLINWVENVFGQTSFGATAIKEQTPIFPYIMGSHTSRYASVNALLYERTGDLVAKEKAYRSFNWSTYMTTNSGVVIDGPDVNHEWFTDGYGDYIRHFMTGIGAVPEWTPANETHLLRSTSIVRNLSYGNNNLSYTTYEGSLDVLHIAFNPAVITADGLILNQRSDLTQPGWTLDPTNKALRIYHPGATQISISSGEAPLFITKNKQIQTHSGKNNGPFLFGNK